MDTPDRNQINTPLSDFQDSPVYNFMNNLSPIKPLKPAHIPQTFNSISFPSPPYVITSPHVNCLKESRFVQRHDDPVETSKPRLSYEDVNRICSSEEALADLTHAKNNSTTESQDNALQGISVGDASIIDLFGEDTKFSVAQPQGSHYYFGCPVRYPPLRGDEASSLLPLPGEAASDVANVLKGCETDSVEGQEHNWDSLIPDATNLLSFNPPYEAETFRPPLLNQMEYYGKVVNLMSLISQSMVNDGSAVDSVASLSHFELIAAATDKDHMQDSTSVALMNDNTNEKVDNELVTMMHRSTWRRQCLNFEMANVQRKSSDDNSNTGTITPQADEKSVVNEKQLLPAQHHTNLQICNMPEIGLHLNEFDSTSLLQFSAIKDYHHHPLISISSERELDQSNNGAQPGEDFFQPCLEYFNWISPSPKRRRCKLEPDGETKGCKRCNCKNSKCLKLYCECFAAGVYCTAPCSCKNCFNQPIHVDKVVQTRNQIKSRDPLAFAPKVIRSSDTAHEIEYDPNKTPAPARHKRGCNCKKSSCNRKYCECYQSGVGCSLSCRCEGCKNTYGRKDGSAP